MYSLMMNNSLCWRSCASPAALTDPELQVHMSSSDMIISFRGHAGPTVLLFLLPEYVRYNGNGAPSPHRLYDNCVRGPFRICPRREDGGDRGPPSAQGTTKWPTDRIARPLRALACLLCSPHPYYFLSTHSRTRCSSHTRPPLRGSLVTRSQRKGAISRVTCIVKQLVGVFMRV